MKHECSIVRDILPLYLEHMVSEDTAAFVTAHLESCAACAAEYEKMGSGGPVERTAPEDAGQEREGSRALVKIKGRIRKRKMIAVGITALCVAAVLSLLHFFPVYRLAEVGIMEDYYSAREAFMLASIGSREDRAAAQSVLRQADAAFHDCGHTREENQALYGPLFRYATAADRGAVSVNCSLELLSAHLDEKDGWLWVRYSHEALDAGGDVICGSWNILSLWKVTKEPSGEWAVTGIKEHP